MLIASGSNTGAQVVPLSRERHTPPPAEPTHSVLRSPDTPSMQAMRPLITPGPSARARRPSNVSESSFQSPLAPLPPLAGFSAGFSAGLSAGFSAGCSPGFSAGLPAGAWAAAPVAVRAQKTTASTNGRAHVRAERTAGMVSLRGEAVGSRAARPAHLVNGARP